MIIIIPIDESMQMIVLLGHLHIKKQKTIATAIHSIPFIPSPPSASSTAADHSVSSRGVAPWLKAACSPGRPFPRHTAARYGQLHSLPASAQVPAAAGRPVLGRVTSLGDHRPPRAGQGSLSGAGRKTGVSWRQATTRQGAGAMVWEGRREKREKGGGRGK